MATTNNDKLMYAVLILAIIAGLATPLGSGVIGEEHNYRETVSVWFRSIFILQPAAPWRRRRCPSRSTP